jgi:hypothetical protein
MSRSIPVCLLALTAICASTVLASAQITSTSTEGGDPAATSSAPVAFVYVSSAVSDTTSQINAFSAAANGALTPIPGSPFHYNVNYMAVNGAWLFAVADKSGDIDSFSIAANGALSKKQQYVVGDEYGSPISVYLDHTGSTLYADLYDTNNYYSAYSIDQSSGELTPVYVLGGGPPNNSPVRFIGDNVFAYSSSCYHFSPELIGVERASNGAFSYINDFNQTFPTAKSGQFFCPWLAAADPTDHVAIAMQPLNSNWGAEGPYQLATYTADSSGNLTTTSTYANMPTTEAGGAKNSATSYVIDYQMSPSGQFLAVAGTSGLQVFNFNGASPLTKLTGLVTKDEIDQLFWDNNNHLYAISQPTNELFVWTVTSKGAVAAPGSPHSIPNVVKIIVLPQ